MSTLSKRAEFLLTGSDRYWILVEIKALEAELRLCKAEVRGELEWSEEFFRQQEENKKRVKEALAKDDK